MKRDLGIDASSLYSVGNDKDGQRGIRSLKLPDWDRSGIGPWGLGVRWAPVWVSEDKRYGAVVAVGMWKPHLLAIFKGGGRE